MQLQVNLLPREYRPKPAVRIWPVLLTILFALNIVGMGSWWFFLQLDLSASRTALALMNDKVSALERQVEEAEAAAALQNEVDAKREYIAMKIADSRCWHPLLEAVERAMVPGTCLKSVSASETGDVAIAGETDTVKSVADLLGSLQAETGLPVIRISSVTPEGAFQVTLHGWSGREVPENEQ